MGIVNLIRLMLSNFGISMMILALLIALASVAIQREKMDKLAAIDTFIAYMLLLGLGLPSIQAFIMHTFFPSFTAEFIGWQTSPFQFEVAVADLAFGVGGILAWRANFGYRVAVMLMSSIFLLGCAVGHIKQMLIANNFAPGNAGSPLVYDILLPVILILLWLLRKKREV